jgi:ubiquinone/menaquinone biosynthesis C-methylase UbiE
MTSPRHQLRWPARIYFWLAERLYNELAWAYEAVASLVSLGRWQGWRLRALDALGEAPGRVLELGFGTGALLVAMAARGWWPVGLEPSPAMQRVAARRLRRARVDARHGHSPVRLRGHAQALPFRDGSFDAAVATFPTEYIMSVETLREVHRVLCPRGCLVIAGLYVEADRRVVRGAERLVFGSASVSEALSRFGALAESCGYEVSTMVSRADALRAPLLILKRREAPSAVGGSQLQEDHG